MQSQTLEQAGWTIARGCSVWAHVFKYPEYAHHAISIGMSDKCLANTAIRSLLFEVSQFMAMVVASKNMLQI